MHKKAVGTPKFASRLLAMLLSKRGHETLIGDFEELYLEKATADGILSARMWFWGQAIVTVFAYCYHFLYWSVVMFANYLKIALRNMKKHKIYAAINLAGLATGMACCFLILSYIVSEFSFDRYHQNADRIYRIGLDGSFGGQGDLTLACNNNPIGPYLRDNYAEVEDAVRFRYMYRTPVKFEEKEFFEESIYYTDASVFNVFAFPMISGDPVAALQNAFSVVLTKSAAEKYFGARDPLGEILIFNNTEEFTVTGVIEDVPEFSHFTFDMLCSFETRRSYEPEQIENWMGDFNNHTYLLLQEGYEYSLLEEKFPAIIDTHIGPILNQVGGHLSFFLQPLKSIHLRSNLLGEISENGDMAYIYLFSAIALFILLLACINFMNLTTARSVNRAREIGVRKVHGAGRTRLIRQFLGESVLYSLLALLIALVLARLALPALNTLAGRSLLPDSAPISMYVTIFFCSALVVGLIAGSYPAFYISSYQPVKILKNEIITGPGGARFRKVLVVFQFIVSTLLIIFTSVIVQQITYMKNKDLGFDQDSVIVLQVKDNEVRRSVDTMKKELAKLTGVLSVSASSHAPGWGGTVNVHLPEGCDLSETQTMSVNYVDENYIPTMGIEISQGRNFSKEYPSDREESIIINEAAVRRLGWENPIGKTITPLYDDNQPKKIIGVVKDFHFRSLHMAIEPLFIWCSPRWIDVISLRVVAGDIPGTLEKIRATWQALSPNSAFDYFFLDESLRSEYKGEEKLREIFVYFSLLAIFIACLGLFGMVSFSAEKRTKEIGIRKVLGAPVVGMCTMLSKQFVKLVLVASLISWPIGYFALHKWLQHFPYHIDLKIWTFLFSTLLAFLVALLTVSFQSLKAARANPVDSLKYE